MVDGKLLIEKLLVYANTFLGLSELDIIYERNTLLHLFNLASPTNEEVRREEIVSLSVPDVLIEEIMAYALENNIVVNETSADLFANYVFGILSPKPSEVNSQFMLLKENLGSQVACDYLYNLSIKNYYIKKSAIDKNIKWEASELDHPLEITINLSKPEKDNKDIAKLASAPKGDKYPACPLCKENEGYYGNAKQAPRSNIRTVKLTLDGEEWGMQYSPYLYFDEHCILFNKKHVPMVVSVKTIEKLFDFIELFPSYFIGSNSDLPIVGGSILNHEHYQGGRHLMPLQKSPSLRKLKSVEYDDVDVEVVDFYNSAIRISGFNRNTVQELAGEIIDKWKVYFDESAQIVAEENGVRHNTVTTIARFLNDNRYSVDLILRNNRVNEEYPDGIFHAHPKYHNIKKEGIGLIEAMGLFVLPARLKRQFNDIADILCHNVSYDAEAINNENHDLFVHREMIENLLKRYPRVKDKNKANEVIIDYVNDVCANILDNTSVFKKDKNGIVAFNKFLYFCGLKIIN
ncbi:MAG: galactose-1-phosphate uridylyltransferase [Clostridia bacterium]|nr:galactose-1-phosphate uridylyltransferase [Clostridia bacterium]